MEYVTNDQDMKMRLCLVGGVIILLVIIIGNYYLFFFHIRVINSCSSYCCEERIVRIRNEFVHLVGLICLSLYAICGGYLLSSGEGGNLVANVLLSRRLDRGRFLVQNSKQY